MTCIALAVTGGIALCGITGALAQDGETPFAPEQIKEMQVYPHQSKVNRFLT